MAFDPARLAARLDEAADALKRCGSEALISHAAAARAQRAVGDAILDIGGRVDARQLRCAELAATVEGAKQRSGEAVVTARDAESGAEETHGRCAAALDDARSCLTTSGQASADAEEWEAEALERVEEAEEELNRALQDEEHAAALVDGARADVANARSRLDAASDADARRQARADLADARARLDDAKEDHELAREEARAARAQLNAARVELRRARQRLANCRQAERRPGAAVDSATLAEGEAKEAGRLAGRAVEFAAGALAIVGETEASRLDLEALLATLARHVQQAGERHAEARLRARANESQHDLLMTALADAGNVLCMKLDTIQRLLAGAPALDASQVSSNWSRVCEALRVGLDNPAIPSPMKRSLEAAALTIASRSLGMGLIDEATTRGQHHPILSKARLGAPGNNGPGYAYEVIATASLMRRSSVAVNTGRTLSIGPDARLGRGLVFWDEDLDGIPPRYAPGGGPRRVEADLGDARAEGIVAIDFKYSKAGRYACSTQDLGRRLKRVHALLSTGAVAEFHYVTNGRFAAGFRDAVDTTNVSLSGLGLRPIGLHEHVDEDTE